MCEGASQKGKRPSGEGQWDMVSESLSSPASVIGSKSLFWRNRGAPGDRVHSTWGFWRLSYGPGTAGPTEARRKEQTALHFCFGLHYGSPLVLSSSENIFLG